MRIKIGWVIIGLLAGGAGCHPQLETGYVPHPLNSTEADRRGYYAPAFTAEAHAKESGTGLQFGR